MNTHLENSILPTVFIVDDDAGLRDALCLLIEADGLHAETYADGSSFLEHYDSDRPGCVLLDQAMPGLSGLQVQQALNETGMEIPIIFLTAHGNVPIAVAAVRNEAFEFLEKPADSDRLLDCVHRALEWDQQNRISRAAALETKMAYDHLTPREREVMQQMIDGHTSKQTGQELELSYRTVEVHRSHILSKMGVENSVQLISKVLECQKHYSGCCQYQAESSPGTISPSV